MIEIVEVEEPIRPDNLGERIKKIRFEKQWTRAMLASKADLTQPTIYSAEHGGNVTLYVLFHILDALGYELRIIEKG